MIRIITGTIFHWVDLTNAVQFDYLDSSIEKPSKVPCYDKNNIIEVTEEPI
jgi:hypothetical protein